MSEEEKNLAKRVYSFRVLVIVFNIIGLIQLILAVTLHDSLPAIIKTWLITIAGTGFIGFCIGLFLSRKDPTVTLFLIILSVFLNGLVCGISILLIVKK